MRGCRGARRKRFGWFDLYIRVRGSNEVIIICFWCIWTRFWGLSFNVTLKNACYGPFFLGDFLKRVSRWVKDVTEVDISSSSSLSTMDIRGFLARLSVQTCKYYNCFGRNDYILWMAFEGEELWWEDLEASSSESSITTLRFPWVWQVSQFVNSLTRDTQYAPA